MSAIRRDDGQILSVPEYAEIMEKESHHNHEIIIDGNGIIRWKEDSLSNHLLKKLPLNELTALLENIGHGKNSEVYRALYRSMGYSLSGYWEIFYWDWNNDEAELYSPPEVRLG